MTLEEIGLKFGLTRERVRQIKEKAIRRLRQESFCASLKPYLANASHSPPPISPPKAGEARRPSIWLRTGSRA